MSQDRSCSSTGLPCPIPGFYDFVVYFSVDVSIGSKFTEFYGITSCGGRLIYFRHKLYRHVRFTLDRLYRHVGFTLDSLQTCPIYVRNFTDMSD